MSFERKYSLCRSCSYSRLHKKIGIVCNLTQAKPAFHLFCNTFTLNTNRDNKISRKNTSFYADNEVVIWTVILFIFLIQVIISKSYILMIILLGAAGYFYYTKFFSKYANKIIQKTGWFGYAYISLAVHITKNKPSITDEFKLIHQKLIMEYGYNTAKQGIDTAKELLTQVIDVKEICVEIRTRYTREEKILLYYLLFEISVLNSYDNIVNESVISTIGKYLDINEKQKEFVFNQIFKEKQKEERRQSRKKKYQEYFEAKDIKLEDAYRILEVNSASSTFEIKKAFRRLAQKYHPDKASLTDINQQQDFKIKFQEILNAYQIIKNKHEIN